MRKKTWVSTALTAVVCVAAALAVSPRKWEMRNMDDFLEGKLEGVSIGADGDLFLAPREDVLEAPAEEFYLSLLPLSDGSVYLGTGHGGKIYRIPKGGPPELFFQTAEMDVVSLAADKKGVLYAGTSPNGKVYKITDREKGEVFFNPAEKYIWDLLFLEDGNLLVAVGEGGGIYAVSPQGEGQQVLKADENHILCLMKDRSGNVIAGSGGDGLVYKITKGGAVSVVFESPYQEIKSLGLDDDGNILAAAAGMSTKEKKNNDLLNLLTSTSVEVIVASQAPVVKAAPSPLTKATAPAPSALFVIHPEGMARKAWSSDDELIYALLWDGSEERILFGTGPKGRVYSLETGDKASLLFQKNCEQVYGLLPIGQKTCILSNNPPQLSLLSQEQRYDGAYLSSVMDAGAVSSWGRVIWRADLPQGAILQVQTRTGNSNEPNQTWSDWSPPYQKAEGEPILSPKSRFLQFRALFKTTSGRQTPRLKTIRLYYLQNNIAPVIRRLEALEPNIVFLKLPEADESILGSAKPPSPGSSGLKEGSSPLLALAKKTERKGYQTILWEAGDENGDSLEFTLSIRKEGESQWRLLEENWTTTLYALDTVSFPDGVYEFRVKASDGPSNPPGLSLGHEKTSRPFSIDNTSPVIKNFSAVRERSTLKVTFLVEDALAALTEVKFLVRPGEWQVVFPDDGICDSRVEAFTIHYPLPAGADNLITVMARDSHQNVGVFRQTF